MSSGSLEPSTPPDADQFANGSGERTLLSTSKVPRDSDYTRRQSREDGGLLDGRLAPHRQLPQPPCVEAVALASFPVSRVRWACRSDNRARVGRVTLQRMDNVGIVVESLDAAISFFAELGLELEGRATIEGEWSGRVTGLRDQRVEIAMMRTPDGHGRIELSRFLAPPVVADHRNAPVNALGYLRVMFAVDDLEDTLARLRRHGAQLVDEVVQYEDMYRLCYVRGPEGILIGLAEQIG